MTHNELINSFALDGDVYLVLYLGVGSMSILMIFIMFLYHYTTNRLFDKLFLINNIEIFLKKY